MFDDGSCPDILTQQNLLEFAQDAGLSVGSLDLQLRFLAWELEERGLLSELQAVRSVREASDLVLFRYEAPLDTGAQTQTVRCGLSMTFYNQFAGTLSQGQKDILEVTANHPPADDIPFRRHDQSRCTYLSGRKRI